MWYGAMASVLLAGSAFAAAIPLTQGIHWYACQQNASIPTTCGTLDVPLDYTETATSENLTLQLVKISSTKQPCKGSIIFDFGGPGNINVDNFSGDNGKALLLMTGGEYDLITFEPRGTGITIPYSCFNAESGRAANRVATPKALHASDNSLEAAWKAAGGLAKACEKNARDIGQLVGTSFVARDIMRIVDALGEDRLLRYYGFSYGTALGATLAAMFPDRMDKIVLDGVTNPAQYWEGILYAEVLDSDAALSAFFAGCIESPHLCAPALEISSAGELSRQLKQVFHDLRVSGKASDIAKYSKLKAGIVQQLYFPVLWPSFSNLVAQTLGINASVSSDGESPLPPSLFPDLAGPEALIGIQCADAAYRAESLEDLKPILKEMAAESWIRGDGDVAINLLKCARWKLTSKERYTGSFDNIQTKSPALIVGNAIDPTTPLASARNVSEGMKGSVLLQNNGYGHTTIATPSLCIARHVRAYFVDGTLPPVGTVCESVTAAQPFAFGGSYLDTIKTLGNVSKRSIGPEEEGDEELFNAVRDFGKSFAESKTGLRME